MRSSRRARRRIDTLRRANFRLAASLVLRYNLTMAHRTRRSTKGQIVLPQAIRSNRRWKPGTEFIVEEDADGDIRLKPALDKTASSWESLIGCVGYRGPRQSLRQIEKALAAEARRHK